MWVGQWNRRNLRRIRAEDQGRAKLSVVNNTAASLLWWAGVSWVYLAQIHDHLEIHSSIMSAWSTLSLAVSLGLVPQAYTPCSVFKRVNVGVGSQWILDKSFVLFRSQESRQTACNCMMGRFYFVWNTEHGWKKTSNDPALWRHSMPCRNVISVVCGCNVYSK